MMCSLCLVVVATTVWVYVNKTYCLEKQQSGFLKSLLNLGPRMLHCQPAVHTGGTCCIGLRCRI